MTFITFETSYYICALNICAAPFTTELWSHSYWLLGVLSNDFSVRLSIWAVLWSVKYPKGLRENSLTPKRFFNLHFFLFLYFLFFVLEHIIKKMLFTWPTDVIAKPFIDAINQDAIRLASQSSHRMSNLSQDAVHDRTRHTLKLCTLLIYFLVHCSIAREFPYMVPSFLSLISLHCLYLCHSLQI